jgi:ERCC4-type nuclease
MRNNERKAEKSSKQERKLQILISSGNVRRDFIILDAREINHSVM